MEKFLEYLQEAEKIIRTTDHLIYMAFPLVKDKRILTKSAKELKKALTYIINSILQYEYIFKRVILYDNSQANFKNFEKKCAPRYDITSQEIELIYELFDFVEKHKKSTMEYFKEDKVIILSESMEQKILTVDKTKEFLSLAKSILQKAKNKILDKI